ncbi:MAG TPA: hypothetical protein DCL54_18410, partial [Alphaproteobacteria bacterium]|nr:hypothetical protein [Alphaproteobacteria bacterium]
MRYGRRNDPKKAIKRDLIAAAALIVAMTCVGVLVVFISADARRAVSGLLTYALVNDPPPPTQQTQKAAAPAPAQGCKYCLTLLEMKQNFEIKAAAAETRRASLAKLASDVEGETGEASTKANLQNAERDLALFRSASSTLAGFAQVCTQQEYCRRADEKGSVPQSCPQTQEDANYQQSAMGMAVVARDAAIACASSSCPQVDCVEAAGVRAGLMQAAGALAGLGIPLKASKTLGAPAQLPVGPAQLAGELERAVKDAQYQAGLFPRLLEPQIATKVQDLAAAPGSDLPVMVPEMMGKLSESIRGSAEVMMQSAIVNPATFDARREAAWRMKSLSLAIADAGRFSEKHLLASADGDKYRLSLVQAWGAALVDLATIRALMDRMQREAPGAQGCDGGLAAAAQAAREAIALIDVCRARAACPVSAGPVEDDPTTNTSRDEVDQAASFRSQLQELIPRVQGAASTMAV